MQHLHALTPLAVRAAAHHLLGLHGTTTPLDVEAALRDRGYRATGAEVALLVARLAAREGWTWWDNGHHRTYAALALHAPPLGMN